MYRIVLLNIFLIKCFDHSVASDGFTMVMNSEIQNSKTKDVREIWENCMTVFGYTKCPDGTCASILEECSKGPPVEGGPPCRGMLEQLCGNGECISKARRCSDSKCTIFQKECQDGHCIAVTSSCPEECEYKTCDGSTPHCYSYFEECDGWEDCFDGRDELNCHEIEPTWRSATETPWYKKVSIMRVSWRWFALVLPAVIGVFIFVTLWACRKSKYQARNAGPLPGPIRAPSINLPPARPSEMIRPITAGAVASIRGQGYVAINSETASMGQSESGDESSAPPPSYNEAVGMQKDEEAGKVRLVSEGEETKLIKDAELPSYDCVVNGDPIKKV